MKPVIVNQRYRRIELLGAGGMATVYRGEDIKLGRPVAMKFLREPYASDHEARQRFMNEARNAAQLDHNAVVRIFDVGEDADNRNRPFIVMEMVDGEDLKALIRREGPLGVAHALSLTRQICLGVGQAHQAGIVHCDLKPQNIIVTPDGKAKVTDFGIARALKHEQARASTTPDDVVWGSPHYLSPEQGRGEALTPASDVYSIGVMLYEMLTGVPPFHDNDPTALVLKHLREEPAPMSAFNPRVPPGLEWLVRKVLSKEPSARYRNANQFATAIEEYINRGADHTGPLDTLQPQSKPSQVAPTVVSPPREAAAQRAALAAKQRPAQFQPARQATVGGQPAVMRPNPASNRLQDTGTQPVQVPFFRDMMLMRLLGVALLAVIGLIPLWIVVYQSYTVRDPVVGPTPGIVATPTSNVSAGKVTVPNLKGLSAEDARSLAEGQGFVVQIISEDVTDDYRPGAVIEQTPNSGSRVDGGSTIGIRVAVGRELTFPDVVDYDLDVVRGGLEDEGLELVILEERSEAPQGFILKQEPDAESVVRVGQTVTLTVSGGLDMPIILNVNLNNQVILEEARVGKNEFFVGDSVPVTLRWRCTANFNQSYKVFVHLLTLDHTTAIGQDDNEPMNGLRPTNSWSVGEVINDPHQVVLNASVPPGEYEIRVGMYIGPDRLPVVDPGETDVFENTIFVDTFTVKQ